MVNVEVDKVRMLSGNLRFKILERDEFKCIYCGSTSLEEELHVDHIFPHSKGGKTDIWNLVTACSACNMGKKAMVLDEDKQKEILNIVKARNKSKGYRKTSDLKPRERKQHKPKLHTVKQYNEKKDDIRFTPTIRTSQDKVMMGKLFVDKMDYASKMCILLAYSSEKYKIGNTIDDITFYTTYTSSELFEEIDGDVEILIAGMRNRSYTMFKEYEFLNRFRLVKKSGYKVMEVSAKCEYDVTSDSFCFESRWNHVFDIKDPDVDLSVEFFQALHDALSDSFYVKNRSWE